LTAADVSGDPKQSASTEGDVMQRPGIVRPSRAGDDHEAAAPAGRATKATSAM